LRRVLVEEGAIVPPGTAIGFDHAADAGRYPVTPGGLVLIPSRAPATRAPQVELV